MNAISREMKTFIDGNTCLVACSLGLAIPVYLIGLLGKRLITWIKKCSGLTKKTSEVAMQALSSSPQQSSALSSTSNSPKISLSVTQRPSSSNDNTTSPIPIIAVSSSQVVSPVNLEERRQKEYRELYKREDEITDKIDPWLRGYPLLDLQELQELYDETTSIEKRYKELGDLTLNFKCKREAWLKRLQELGASTFFSGTPRENYSEFVKMRNLYKLSSEVDTTRNRLLETLDGRFILQEVTEEVLFLAYTGDERPGYKHEKRVVASTDGGEQVQLFIFTQAYDTVTQQNVKFDLLTATVVETPAVSSSSSSSAVNVE